MARHGSAQRRPGASVARDRQRRGRGDVSAVSAAGTHLESSGASGGPLEARPLPSTLALAAAVALSTLALASTASAADTRLSPWHLDVDVALGAGHAAFIGVAVPADVPEEHRQAAPTGRDPDVLRLGAAAALAGLALEGSVVMSPGADAYLAWSLGVRLESAWRDVVAVQIRAGYVHRVDVPGEGARFGLGVIVRPTDMLALYAEAYSDLTTVPEDVHATGALLAYLVAGSAGVRVAFR